MAKRKYLAAACVAACAMFGAIAPGQDRASAQDRAPAAPSLPVVDYKACPFEGCTFGKWIVMQPTTIFSTWRKGRHPVGTLAKGEIVTGLTGVHITFEPDQISIQQDLPELQLRSGDVIQRYMYRGEGFCDLWIKGQWKRDFECTFMTEKNNSGCLRDCSAVVISEGKKDWWVRLRTTQGSIGWSKAEGQFDCMDRFGGNDECDAFFK
jgi:hypothetical protein